MFSLVEYERLNEQNPFNGEAQRGMEKHGINYCIIIWEKNNANSPW